MEHPHNSVIVQNPLVEHKVPLIRNTRKINFLDSSCIMTYIHMYVLCIYIYMYTAISITTDRSSCLITTGTFTMAWYYRRKSRELIIKRIPEGCIVILCAMSSLYLYANIVYVCTGYVCMYICMCRSTNNTRVTSRG